MSEPSGEKEGLLAFSSGWVSRFGSAPSRVDFELVERLDEFDVPAVAAHRPEDDPLAVGRPRRIVVLAVAVGELTLVVAVEADDEQVRAAVADPADAVELEEDAGEPPRRAGLRSSSSSYASSRYAAREGDAARVGRPGDRLDGLLAVGQPPRLAAVGRQDVELSLRLLLVLAVAVRDEGEPAPVGRPAGRPVVPLAGGELPRLLGAVERRHPDRGAVGVRLLVDPADDVGDAPAVGRKARVADARERIDVLGLHSGHRGATLVFSRRGRGGTGRRGGFRSRWAARPLEVRVLSPALRRSGANANGVDHRREDREPDRSGEAEQAQDPGAHVPRSFDLARPLPA